MLIELMTVFYRDNIPLHDSDIMWIKEQPKRRQRKESECIEKRNIKKKSKRWKIRKRVSFSIIAAFTMK